MDQISFICIYDVGTYLKYCFKQFWKLFHQNSHQYPLNVSCSSNLLEPNDPQVLLIKSWNKKFFPYIHIPIWIHCQCDLIFYKETESINFSWGNSHRWLLMNISMISHVWKSPTGLHWSCYGMEGRNHRKLVWIYSSLFQLIMTTGWGKKLSFSDMLIKWEQSCPLRPH